MTEMKVYILILTFIEIAVFEMQSPQSMAELNQIIIVPAIAKEILLCEMYEKRG